MPLSVCETDTTTVVEVDKGQRFITSVNYVLNEQNDGLAFSDIVRDDRVLSYTHANHVHKPMQHDLFD